MPRKFKKLFSGLAMCLALSAAFVAPQASARIMADGCYWLVTEGGQVLGLVCCRSDYCTIQWL